MATFDVKKAIAIAQKIIIGCKKQQNNEDYSVDRITLLKLMYLVERQHFANTGLFITNDTPVSMKYGVVLSTTYNLIKGNSNYVEKAVLDEWNKYIASKDFDNIDILQPFIGDILNAQQIEIINCIITEYGGIDTWDMVGMLHRALPEWTPTDSSIEISTSLLTEIIRPMTSKRKQELVNQVLSSIDNQ